MRFTCSHDELMTALQVVSRALSTRTPLQILENIHLDARADGLTLVATDLEMGIRYTLGASVEEEGSVLLRGKLLSEIVRRLPGGEVHMEGDERSGITLSCRNSDFRLQALSTEEYPALPTPEEDSPIELEQGPFKEMIQQTAYAVAQDDVRPILTGVLIQAEGDDLCMVAIDGNRLALRRGKLEKAVGAAVKTVIPGRTLSEVARILDNQGSMSVLVGRKHVLVDIGYTQVILRVLEGEFIRYEQILPRDYQSRVVLTRQDLIDSVERASLVAREGQSNSILLQLREEELEISSRSEMGSAKDQIPVALEGKELLTAFNARYILEALKSCGDEQIVLDFNAPLSPCVLHPVEGENFIMLVMPVRVPA